MTLRPFAAIAALASLCFLPMSGCSINRLALKATADALTAPGSEAVFTGDDDPELVADALPFAIKMYESLLANLPEHDGLALTTGSMLVMYANAFVQEPAESEDDYEARKRQLARAKRLYLRAYDVLVPRLEARRPGICASDDDTRRKALERCDREDVPFLYWSAAATAAAVALDPLDIRLGARLPLARDRMARAYELDPGFNRGAIDDFYISFYAGLPAGMGGGMAKAERHFELAVERSGGAAASPYVSAAAAIAVPRQDYALFKSLLGKAIALDPDAYPDMRLANIIARRKAERLAAAAEYLFIVTDDSPTPDEEGEL